MHINHRVLLHNENIFRYAEKKKTFTSKYTHCLSSDCGGRELWGTRKVHLWVWTSCMGECEGGDATSIYVWVGHHPSTTVYVFILYEYILNTLGVVRYVKVCMAHTWERRHQFGQFFSSAIAMPKELNVVIVGRLMGNTIP